MIEWVELQLVKIGGAHLDVEIVPYDNLDDFWSLADESARSFEHTVAWLDCAAGGGVFSLGPGAGGVRARLGRGSSIRCDMNFRPISSSGPSLTPRVAPPYDIRQGLAKLRFGLAAFLEQ